MRTVTRFEIYTPHRVRGHSDWFGVHMTLGVPESKSDRLGYYYNDAASDTVRDGLDPSLIEVHRVTYAVPVRGGIRPVATEDVTAYARECAELDAAVARHPAGGGRK